MATNFFKVFNTTKTNMQSDTDYNAETQRINGVSGIAKSIMHNKLFRQVSIMAYAIGEFIKGAGYDASDADEAALVTALSNAVATKASVDAKSLFETAGGTSTAITLGTAQQIDKYSTTFIASANNSGAATTINTRPLYKPGTAVSPTLIAGKAYTIWYSLTGTCFFVKASAIGTAAVGDVLASKTFTNDIDTGLTGTIPSKTAQTYNPSTSAQTINSGQYLSGNQTISPTTGTATTGHVLAGDTFNSSSGIGLTGTMTSQKGDGNQGYTNMNGKISNTWVNPSIGRLHFPIIAGAYLNNATYPGIERDTPMGFIDDPEFIPSNFLSSANVFGMQGTAVTGKRVASGIVSTGTTQYSYVYRSGASTSWYGLTVSGLTFTPNIILCMWRNGTAVGDSYTMYSPLSGYVLQFTARDSGAQESILSYQVTADCYINSTGFRLPSLPNITYNWIAYE